MSSTFLLWLILNALAGYRVTRLITRDRITAGFRRWMRNNYSGQIVNLVHCDWCVSVWVGAAFAVPTLLWPTEWRWVITIIGAMTVMGIISERDTDRE